MIPGSATAEGTQRYAQRLEGRVSGEHFRRFDADLRVSSIGAGTYLGPEDAATDAAYTAAIGRALDGGINVVDTAVNYRHQRSERAVRGALEAAIQAGRLRRDEVLIATKGGFIPFDAEVPGDPVAYFRETYVRPGLIRHGEVAGGAHCIAPRFLADQVDRSRKNLGLETIDVYYVHNPETQLTEVDRATLAERLREAFAALEHAVEEGKIRWYGAATWNGFRVDPSAPEYLSLAEVVALAREAGGESHHFKMIQLPYNLAMPEAFTRANQRVENDTVPTLEAARRLGVYVTASASVYQGQLTRNLPAMVAEYLPGLSTDGQRAIQFVRSTPGLGTALVGMKSAAHVDENLGVAAQAPLPWERFKRMFSPA